MNNLPWVYKLMPALIKTIIAMSIELAIYVLLRALAVPFLEWVVILFLSSYMVGTIIYSSPRCNE